MSLGAMVWAMRQETGSPITKLILVKLADNANDETGLCWPSLNTVARVTEVDRSTVIRHIRKLVELGMIKVIHRGKDGVSLPNHYLLLFPSYTALTLKGGSGTVPLGDAEAEEGSGTVPLEVVAGCDQGSGTVPPKPVSEPVSEPPPPPTPSESEVVVEFPQIIKPEIRPAIIALLAMVKPADQQNMLDDFAGWLETQRLQAKPVRSLAGVLRKMVERYLCGGWVPELAHIGQRLRQPHAETLKKPSAAPFKLDPEASAKGAALFETVSKNRRRDAEVSDADHQKPV